MKNIESYCELCQNITIWFPERIEIAGQMEDMLRCSNSTNSCLHYSTTHYLEVMQKKYMDRVKKIGGNGR